MSRPALPAGPYLVAGAGRAGRAAAEALASRPGADDVVAWDAAEGPAQQQAARRLRELGVRVVLGGDGVELLHAEPSPRVLVKSPGIPATAPLPAAAHALGLTVLDELELGWRLDDRPLVAITGTNGKSTVASLAVAVLRAAGLSPALAGNTRDGPPLSALDQGDGDVVVGEVSSFQLECCPALLPDVAVLTNLSEDHLLHHGGAQAYAAAKRRLFVRDDRAAALAVIGVGQPFGRELAATVEACGGRVLSVGEAGAYALTSSVVGWPGTTFDATTPLGAVTLRLRHHGVHMAENALAALALADGLGVPRAVATRAIESAAPVAGRFERVDGGGPVAVVVDFAHNEDGVRRTLETARALAGGRGRIVVVACAPWSYPTAQQRHIGRQAGTADEVVVTSDRWSADEPAEPPPPLVSGVTEQLGRPPLVLADRAEAIEAALATARAGDLVLVLGRGTRLGGVSVDGVPVSFDDRAVTRALLGLGG